MLATHVSDQRVAHRPDGGRQVYRGGSQTDQLGMLLDQQSPSDVLDSLRRRRTAPAAAWTRDTRGYRDALSRAKVAKVKAQGGQGQGATLTGIAARPATGPSAAESAAGARTADLQTRTAALTRQLAEAQGISMRLATTRARATALRRCPRGRREGGPGGRGPRGEGPGAGPGGGSGQGRPPGGAEGRPGRGAGEGRRRRRVDPVHAGVECTGEPDAQPFGPSTGPSAGPSPTRQTRPRPAARRPPSPSPRRRSATPTAGAPPARQSWDCSGLMLHGLAGRRQVAAAHLGHAVRRDHPHQPQPAPARRPAVLGQHPGLDLPRGDVPRRQP